MNQYLYQDASDILAKRPSDRMNATLRKALKVADELQTWLDEHAVSVVPTAHVTVCRDSLGININEVTVWDSELNGDDEIDRDTLLLFYRTELSCYTVMFDDVKTMQRLNKLESQRLLAEAEPGDGATLPSSKFYQRAQGTAPFKIKGTESGRWSGAAPNISEMPAAEGPNCQHLSSGRSEQYTKIIQAVNAVDLLGEDQASHVLLYPSGYQGHVIAVYEDPVDLSVELLNPDEVRERFGEQAITILSKQDDAQRGPQDQAGS